MPREIRKRGKKKKTQPEEKWNDGSQQDKTYQPESVPVASIEPQAGPSWMRDAPARAGPSGDSTADAEAPFGYVDAEVKAYFRTVDLKLREWQDGNEGDVAPEGVDPNEERKTFVLAALSEMSGKELQLATDPDCSTILERLAHSMDDFARRVFMDRLSGSYIKLAKHRFASHVCQTHFTLAQEVLQREAVLIKPSEVEGPRTMTTLIADAAEEILESLKQLIMDPFASHVIRALIQALSPDPSQSTFDSHAGRDAAGPSKKSAAFKAKQGSMKSVLGRDSSAIVSGSTTKGKARKTQASPELVKVANQYVERLRRELSDNEIRALASDKVANPVLQIMIRIEAENNNAERAGSLMDRILMGLVTQLDEQSATLVREDYIETLLRDPSSSHLVETLVRHAPPRVFTAIWTTYFVGRLTKLAAHPVSNFVVARAIDRLEGGKLADVMDEIKPAFGRTIRLGRTGIHRALIDRAAATASCEFEVIESLAQAFGFSGDDNTLFVPCVLRLQTLEDYHTANPNPPASTEPDATTDNDRRFHKQKQKASTSPFNTQGAVLLQSALRLHEPHNRLVIDSLLAQPIDELLSIACDPTGSRVIDVVLETDSKTVPLRVRKKLVMAFLGHFPTLVDDKLGSRVADRCWDAADIYLREKIAKSLIPHEIFLAQSFYGKFFARNLHLTLLQRNPEQWRITQSQGKTRDPAIPGQQLHSAAAASSSSQAAHNVEAGAGASTSPKRKKREREAQPADAIDAIFDSTSERKRKKISIEERAEMASAVPVAVTDAHAKASVTDKGLNDILGAIKDIPKGQALREGKYGKKKSKVH